MAGVRPLRARPLRARPARRNEVHPRVRLIMRWLLKELYFPAKPAGGPAAPPRDVIGAFCVPACPAKRQGEKSAGAARADRRLPRSPCVASRRFEIMDWVLDY